MYRFGVGLLVLALGGVARADGRITLSEPDLYDLQAVGFEIPREVEVEIDAVGRWSRRHASPLERWLTGEERPLDVYGWIIDSATRKPLWIMSGDESTRESATLQRVTTKVRLSAGRHELYLFSGYRDVAQVESQTEREGRPVRWWESLFSGGENPEALRTDLKQCHVALSFPGLAQELVRRFEVTGDRPGALIALNRAGDSTFERRTFEIDRPLSLRIYTLFEQLPDSSSPYDYGWIVDARTREVVWHPDRAHPRGAGGGEKNRLVDAELPLPAGRYEVCFGTDDSHSFSEFNTNPPHDPFNWGLTLSPGTDFDAAAFRVLPVAAPPPLLDLSGVDDRQSRKQRFVLERAGKLHVRALGECVGDGPCADRAWITDLASSRAVWEIAPARTIGAGGAQKNRLFDGLVELPAGEYMLHYQTDDSHAYPHWNSAAPFEPAAWGVRVWAGPGLRPGDLEVPDEERHTRP